MLRDCRVGLLGLGSGRVYLKKKLLFYSVLLTVYCVPLVSWPLKEVRKILGPLEL